MNHMLKVKIVACGTEMPPHDLFNSGTTRNKTFDPKNFSTG